MENYRDLALEAIIEALQDGYEEYVCDLQANVFGNGDWVVYDYEAIKMLEDYQNGIFGAIDEIVTYEQDNYGNVLTDFSNPCTVINQLWYIIGGEVIDDHCFLYDSDCWEAPLHEKERKNLIEQLEEYL